MCCMRSATLIAIARQCSCASAPRFVLKRLVRWRLRPTTARCSACRQKVLPAVTPFRLRCAAEQMSERRGLKYIWRTVPRAPSTLFDTVKDVHPAMVQVMYTRGLAEPDLCQDFLAGVCRDA